MSGKFVRASKYRHVFGQAAKKELSYENLKITKNAWDSNIIATNGDYLSVNWNASGGGAFAVIPLLEVGKAPDTVPLFRGHKGPVLDTCFDPFDKHSLASCSDDGKICIWKIPEDYSFHKYLDEEENVKDITEPAMVLSGHTRKVGHVEYHPCAQNVLASCSMDYSVKIWNLETGKCEVTLQHPDLVTSFAFNYNGSLLATTSRDKKLRIWDILSGEVLSEGAGHTGAKPSRVIWAGNTDRIITTGFSRLSDRQVGVWDVKSIENGPIDGFMVIDASSGVLIPLFDEATSILFLAGKGDGNIRYYELENDYLHELSQYASTDPQRGFAATPKSAVNVKENEIMRTFKTINDSMVEPVSFIVPRRSELFQEDIYPDCPSDKPALSASEWFDGKQVNGPLLISMEAIYEGTSPAVRESDPAINVSEVKEKKAEEQRAAKETAATAAKKSVSTTTSVREAEVGSTSSSNHSPTMNTPKSVHDMLDSSKEVGLLLDKVNDRSDDEHEHLKSGDEWDAVDERESKRSFESKSPSKAADKVEATAAAQAEPACEPEKKSTDPVAPLPKSESDATKTTTKNVEPVAATSEPAETRPVPATTQEDSTRKATAAKSGAHTLTATVEKLAGIVAKLEAHIDDLISINTAKDQKLAELEEKVDLLASR